MALIDNCKTAMRIVTTAYDTEIQEYIDAAKLDATCSWKHCASMTTTTIAAMRSCAASG